MAVGLSGVTGAIVLSRVVEEYRIDRELVPIPRRLLEDSLVLGRVTRLGLVTRILAQVMTKSGHIHIVITAWIDINYLTTLSVAWLLSYLKDHLSKTALYLRLISFKKSAWYKWYSLK